MDRDEIMQRQMAWSLQLGLCNGCEGYIPLEIAQAGRGVEVKNGRLEHRVCPVPAVVEFEQQEEQAS